MAHRYLPIAGNTLGLAQTCTVANTDYAVAVPDRAVSLVIWFVDGDDAIIPGRLAISETDDAITVTAASHSHLPPMPVEFDLHRYIGKDGSNPLYIHVACSEAGAVAYGAWLY